MKKISQWSWLLLNSEVVNECQPSVDWAEKYSLLKGSNVGKIRLWLLCLQHSMPYNGFFLCDIHLWCQFMNAFSCRLFAQKHSLMASSGSVQRVSLTDEEQRLVETDNESNAPENQEWFRGCTVFYTLPRWRLFTILYLLLLIDVIVTNALWLTGVCVMFMW